MKSLGPLLIILRLLFPVVQRKVADRVANYLEDRRTKPLGDDETAARPEGCPPCPPCPETAAEEDNSTIEAVKPVSATSPWWYALSGLVLGCAFSAVAYLVAKRLTAA